MLVVYEHIYEFSTNWDIKNIKSFVIPSFEIQGSIAFIEKLKILLCHVKNEETLTFS